MATTTVLSAVFLQKQQVSFAPLSAPLSAPRPSFSSFSRLVSPYCCQNNPLSSSIRQNASLHHVEGDDEAPRKTTSRRDAIALFLQVALLCTPNGNAQAAESGFRRIEGFDLEQLRKELEFSSDVSSVLGFKSKLLGKVAGFALAYQGTGTSSGSSLGFLGCLVFGFLFVRERLTRVAKDASLEDVQLRIKKAGTELCLQTRSSVRYKLEESQLGNGDRRETPLDEALQRQLMNVKSSVIERGKQLDVNKLLTESLRQHATGLTASIKVLEKDCRSLMGNVDKQLDLRRKLEAELQHMDMDLQLKAKEISSLRVAMEDQDQVYNEMVKEHVVVESSLDKFNKRVLDLEREAKGLESSLLATNAFAESLAKQRNLSITRNEALEGKVDELLMSLQLEQATFIKHLADNDELLNLKGEEKDTRSAELMSELNELESNGRKVSQLTFERDELMKVVREKKTGLDNLKKMLNLNAERLRTFEEELATLQQQLLHVVLRPLLQASSEVENQISTEKELIAKLEKELHHTIEALSSSKVEVSSLRDSLQSILSSQAQLQEDLARLSEAQEACRQALKKEKRAVAYTKRQLALCKEIMSEESQVMEELQNDVEEVRRLVEDSKEKILFQANKLEEATETVSRLTDDIFSLKAALKEKQTRQMNLDGREEVYTSVGKPLRRRNTSKQTTPKIRKNSIKSSSALCTGSLSIVNENGKAVVDGYLGSSIAG